MRVEEGWEVARGDLACRLEGWKQWCLRDNQTNTNQSSQSKNKVFVPSRSGRLVGKCVGIVGISSTVKLRNTAEDLSESWNVEEIYVMDGVLKVCWNSQTGDRAYMMAYAALAGVDRRLWR